MNYDYWKLSNPTDDGFGYDMVSPCCGCSYEESRITDCCHVEVINKYIYELDSIERFCDACNEVPECSGYVCNECGNWFEDPEDSRDHDDRMREKHLEDIAEAERKYGE
tara:strand:- start:132 stop:458 length:327 start_codon:yes stop_codon:yes gene_type:complete